MGRKRGTVISSGRPSPHGVRVQVCDGCCCGTAGKHPGVDHAGIRQQLANAATAAKGACRVVDCIDECSRSNVVTVRPAGSPVRLWIGGVHTTPVVDALCDWISRGATGDAPPEIAEMIFNRTENIDRFADDNTTPVELKTSK